MADLRSSWQIAVIAGEPHSTIRIQNLQASVCGGRDAWGRIGKTQPVLISATISLREPFEKASTEDSVNNSSTVNYGTLSRAILEAVESFPTEDTGRMLRSLLDHILRHLTARGLDFRGPTSNEASSQSVLDRTALKSLELKLMLPKASLIGSGVSLSGTIVYAENGDMEAYSMTLKLHRLRIPTLIGVNSNERLAKQIVLSNIELDFWSMASDLYNELEEIVVKTIEESSFQTLEALATHVSQRIILYFLIPRTRHSHDGPRERIKICLEKPTAVTFADAPAVEILVEASPTTNPLTQRLLSANAGRKSPPFPLSTRFDLWIQENDSTSNCVEYTIPS